MRSEAIQNETPDNLSGVFFLYKASAAFDASDVSELVEIIGHPLEMGGRINILHAHTFWHVDADWGVT